MIVKLLGARLSTNPETQVIAHADGVKGQCNVTKNGKKFYIVDYRYMQGGLFSKKAIIMWSDDNGQFPVPASEYNENKGLEQTATLVRFGREEGVTPYEIDGKFVDNVTLLIFEDQDTLSVFNSWKKGQENRINGGSNGGGHEILDTKSPEDELEELEAKLAKATTPSRKNKLQAEIDALIALHPELQ